MPEPLLPTDDRELAELIREHGQTAVARMFGVTQQAVSKAVRARNLNVPRRPTYFDTIPWKVRGEHVDHMTRRLLRYYAQELAGKPLAPKEARALARWRKVMDRRKLVVDYRPNDPKGPFRYVKAREGIDAHYVRTPEPGNPYVRPQFTQNASAA